VDANLLPTGKEAACREAKGGSPSTRLVWVGLITHLDELSYTEEFNRENRTDQETWTGRETVHDFWYLECDTSDWKGMEEEGYQK
jgi:hypothetical protein